MRRLVGCREKEVARANKQEEEGRWVGVCVCEQAGVTSSLKATTSVLGLVV